MDKHCQSVEGHDSGNHRLTRIVFGDLGFLVFDSPACVGEIYGEGGKCDNWASIQGTKIGSCADGKIIRVSRQSNSGTYHYFRSAIMPDSRDFALGSRDLHGSKDVVELVERTPCAIGYSGMGYLSDHVRSLCIIKTKGGPCASPSEKAVLDKSYPIARELRMYTLGQPQGILKNYLDWIRGEEAQKIVRGMGYVSIKQPPVGE